MSSIYQDVILDHYRYPHNFGKLSHPTNSVDLNNPLCGDKLHMEIHEENGVVKEIAFSGEGCAISQASASLLTDYVKGKPVNEVQKLDTDFVLNELLHIQLTPNRIKCAVLSLEAITKLLQ